MKIIIYSHSKQLHQNRAKIFQKGLQKHGLLDVTITTNNKPVPCDIAVMWGISHFQKVIMSQKLHKKDTLVWEAGYILDRHKWKGIGYNGLNGRADFCNKNSPPDRWEQYFSHLLQPWKDDGKYILLTGQVTGDASLQPVNGRVNYQEIVNEIKKYTKLPIHYRKHPHPKRSSAPCPKGAIPSKGTLEQALSKAHCVVTFNSNTSVDAILSGTPCIVLDKGSMAWDVCGHNLNEVNDPPRPDRMQWAYDTAYTQWTMKEIESGDAWEHLMKRYM